MESVSNTSVARAAQQQSLPGFIRHLIFEVDKYYQDSCGITAAIGSEIHGLRAYLTMLLERVEPQEQHSLTENELIGYPASDFASSDTSDSGTYVTAEQTPFREEEEEEPQVSTDEDRDMEFMARAVGQATSSTMRAPSSTHPPGLRIANAKNMPKRHTQKWPAKRKEAPVSHSPPMKKPFQLDRLSENFSTVLSMPKHPPMEIHQEFCRLNIENDLGFDENRCVLLTRLFFAIGSPDAVVQLHDACMAFKASNSRVISSTGSIADSVKTLDKLDVNVHFYAVMRRFHLVSLCRHRDDLLADIRMTRGSRLEDVGRSESLAQKKLMSHAYPDLKPANMKQPGVRDEYTSKSKGLTYRIMVGQRWSMLAKAFTPGILALLPTRGDFQLSNTDFEKLPSAAIELLIDVLKQHRDEFLQQVSACLTWSTLTEVDLSLASQDLNGLKKQSYDSPRLVDFCKGEYFVPDVVRQEERSIQTRSQ